MTGHTTDRHGRLECRTVAEGLIAAVVAAIVSGAIGLLGVWYQARRRSREIRGRLIAARINATRRYVLGVGNWFAIAKGHSGPSAAGSFPPVVTEAQQELALIGDATLISRYLDALSWLSARPDAGGLTSEEQSGLASLFGDLDRALGAQELLAIEGKALRTVSDKDRQPLDKQATTLAHVLGQPHSAAGSPVRLVIHPADDDAFARALREAISADQGTIDGAVGRVGRRLQQTYPNVRLQLTANPDGSGQRTWRAYRDGRSGRRVDSA